MSSYRHLKSKFLIGCSVVGLSMGATAGTMIPASFSNVSDLGGVDLEVGTVLTTSPVQSSGDNVGPLGVATFSVTTTGQTAAIVVDPRPPLPGIPDFNYDIQLFEIDASGNFVGAVGGSYSQESDNSLLFFNSAGLVANAIYAIVVGNSATGMVDFTRFDGLQVTVPIPAAAFLFIGGLGALVGWRKRQNQTDGMIPA